EKTKSPIRVPLTFLCDNRNSKDETEFIIVPLWSNICFAVLLWISDESGLSDAQDRLNILTRKIATRII
ncbi:MAG TPA: hypothetical protein QF838_10690, partial [SAR202 cluster bacterium]|nr:hypothetical protein [SAR202 cluster bacterium]